MSLQSLNWRYILPSLWSIYPTEIFQPLTMAGRTEHFRGEYEEFGFELSIDNFLDRTEALLERDAVEGPLNTKWVMQVYPKGRTLAADGFLSLYLCMKVDAPAVAFASVKFRVSSGYERELYRDQRRPRSVHGYPRVAVVITGINS